MKSLWVLLTVALLAGCASSKALEDENTELRQENNRLQEQISSLEGQKQELQKRIEELEKRIQELQTRIQELEQELARLEAQGGGDQEELARLQMQLQERDKRIADLEQMIARLEQVIARLEVQVRKGDFDRVLYAQILEDVYKEKVALEAWNKALREDLEDTLEELHDQRFMNSSSKEEALPQ
ncbi:MAG: hypothetical protein LBD74_01675 [Spirochaetaceae bacterium]|jgi:chromosome segregation ATPase|nr:hypothetical protein [Spirochaetaceae bacterium]